MLLDLQLKYLKNIKLNRRQKQPPAIDYAGGFSMEKMPMHAKRMNQVFKRANSS